MHERAAEFKERAADEYGLDIDVHEFPAGTKTAADAAEAVGCDVAQIASSITMMADEELVVVITSGANRVSEAKIGDLVGTDPSEVRMANPDEIKSTLGWSIGGVPPICHETAVPVFMDETLLEFDEVWAAGGTPMAVFPVEPERIRELAEASVADVAE